MAPATLNEAQARVIPPSPPLPKFANAPIAEVALSVQFEPLFDLRMAHFGLLWERFRADFPKTREHAPIDRVIEDFGARPPSSLGVQLEVLDELPLPRCWFLNESETELIQVQRDRLIVNWRKGSGEDQYPHFARVRALFERAYREFNAFIEKERLGNLVPDQCEVTYVDHITGDGVWERHGQLEKILTVWSPPNADYLPLEPENARLAVQYAIPGDSEEPVGRLHIQVQGAYRRSDGVPIIVMNTTARGGPAGDSVESVLRFFDIGHEWALRAFMAVTSPEMQRVWRKLDG